MNSLSVTEIGLPRASAIGDTPQALAKLRVAICYLWRHQKPLDLDAPATFTELVQHRKLHNRDLRMAAFADKVGVKDIVAATLGQDWVIPTLWHGTELPAQPLWPLPCVLKSRHGCNQIRFFRDSFADWPEARRRAEKWVDSTYGIWLDEWLYKQIPHGLLVEPFVGQDGVLPVDYKIYTFGGQATYVQVHLEREKRHRWLMFDRDWRVVSSRDSVDDNPKPPKSLPAMLEAAEALGQGFDFVRSDFYEVGGKPLFGEMTFYPGSGLNKFYPASVDAVLGAHWLQAGGR